MPQKNFPPAFGADPNAETEQAQLRNVNVRSTADQLAKRGEPTPFLDANAKEFQPSERHDMDYQSGVSGSGQDQRDGALPRNPTAGAAGRLGGSEIVGDGATGMPTDDYPREEHLETVSGGPDIMVAGTDQNRVTPPHFPDIKDYPAGGRADDIGKHDMSNALNP